MINRVIVMVLDGFGVGEAPDASDYKDEGSNTLEGIYREKKPNLPNMKKMGLYNIEGINIKEKEEKVIGAYGKAKEQAVGKNSPVGHWEMSGYILKDGFYWEVTLNAIRAGKLALIVPVMIFVVGRCVAMTMCIPTARANWAIRAMGSSTSLPAVIIKSPNSSMMTTIYGINS